MLDYRSICANCKFILNNLNYLDSNKVQDFNNTINYFIDEVIKEKFTKKINS